MDDGPYMEVYSAMSKKHRYEDAGTARPKKKHRFLRSFLPWKGDGPGEVVRKLVLIVALAVFVVSGSILVNRLVILPLKSDGIINDAQRMYQRNHSLVTSEPASQDPDNQEPPPESQEPPKDEQGRLLSFEELLQKNSDVKGWISVPNTKIANPVVQSSDENDPEHYLYRDLNDEYSNYGTVFMDYRNDMSEWKNIKNYVLYGHHMRDGRMFANLMYYSGLKFYKGSPAFIFDTLYEEADWKIIAVIKCNTREDQGEPFNYVRTQFSSDEDFMNFVYQVRARSLINCPVDVNENDTLVTLSTCSYEYEDFRTAVIARKVRPGESAAVDVEQAEMNPNPLMPDVYYRSGGTPPTVTDFKTALAAGEIDWYDGSLSAESEPAAE